VRAAPAPARPSKRCADGFQLCVGAGPLHERFGTSICGSLEQADGLARRVLSQRQLAAQRLLAAAYLLQNSDFHFPINI